MKTDVLIIGAGPYGVSLAYDLFLRGVDFKIVGNPFSLWLNHTMSNIRLRSDMHASEIYTRDDRFHLKTFLKQNYSSEQFKDFIRSRIPISVFQHYLHWVLSELPFDILNEKIISLEKKDSYYVALTENQKSIIASKVVIATGIESHHKIPSVLTELQSDEIVHTMHPKAYEDLKNKHVLIVGGGQSAGEVVIHLSKHNSVTWLHRSPLIFYSEPLNLPKPLFLLVLRFSLLFQFLPRKLHQKLAKKFIQPTITPDLKKALHNESIHVLQGEIDHLKLQKQEAKIHSQHLQKDFDAIIAATGYEYSLESLGFLSPALLKTITKLQRNFCTNVNNLFMIGGITESMYGPAQRFMVGCRHATQTLGKVLDEK